MCLMGVCVGGCFTRSHFQQLTNLILPISFSLPLPFLISKRFSHTLFHSHSHSTGAVPCSLSHTHTHCLTLMLTILLSHTHQELALTMWALGKWGHAPEPAWADLFWSEVYCQLPRFRCVRCALRCTVCAMLWLWYDAICLGVCPVTSLPPPPCPRPAPNSPCRIPPPPPHKHAQPTAAGDGGLGRCAHWAGATTSMLRPAAQGAMDE